MREGGRKGINDRKERMENKKKHGVKDDKHDKVVKRSKGK